MQHTHIYTHTHAQSLIDGAYRMQMIELYVHSLLNVFLVLRLFVWQVKQ